MNHAIHLHGCLVVWFLCIVYSRNQLKSIEYLHAGDVDREHIPVGLRHDEARHECGGGGLELHLVELGVGVVKLNDNRLAEVRQALAESKCAALGA